MKLSVMVVMATLVVSLSVNTAVAQGQSENLAQGFVSVVKPGMAAQFEAAVKQHVEWRQQNNDPWTWTWFEVVNGETLGQYLVRSGNHRWADFDAYEEWNDRTGARAHFQTTVGPYLESIRSWITQQNAALSRQPENFNEISLLSVTEFDVRSPVEFFGAAAKFRAAADEANWGGPALWQMGVNGISTALLVVPVRNWAGFALPAQSGPAMLTEVYGQDEAREVMQQFGRSVRSQQSYVLRVRSDLSGR